MIRKKIEVFFNLNAITVFKLTMTNQQTDKMKAISLFSGMGGDTLGFEQANVDVVAYSELRPTFRKTHEANFPDSKVIGENVNSDITKITDEEFKTYENQIQFLFAGFPCQSFSSGGLRKVNDPRNTLFTEFVRAARIIKPDVIIGENVKGLVTKRVATPLHSIQVEVQELNSLLLKKESNLKKEQELKKKNETDLTNKEEQINKTEELKKESKKLVLKIKRNITKITKLEKEISDDKKLIEERKEAMKNEKTKFDALSEEEQKEQENIKYVDVIIDEFKQLGYKVKTHVFKCHYYGVPQKRERLLILGIKQDLVDTKYKLEFPPEQDTQVGLQDIIKFSMKGTVPLAENDKFDFDTIPKECMKPLTNNKNKEDPDIENAHPYIKKKIKESVDPEYNYKGQTFEETGLFSFGKRESGLHCEIIDIRNPSKTIICTYEHQPRLLVPICNKKGTFVRMLLPEELKQIQGFPKDYKMEGTNKEQIIQIGNAVPPQIVKQLVEHIVI